MYIQSMFRSVKENELMKTRFSIMCLSSAPITFKSFLQKADKIHVYKADASSKAERIIYLILAYAK